MRKIKFLLVALFALIGMNAFAALPKAGDTGFLYNLGSGQFITADATLGETGVEFTIEIKEKDANATPTVEGAAFMRFKTGSNYLTFYQEPAVMSTYYGQLVVKATEKGLLITHPYPNDQGPSWITAGSYLQVVDGALATTALDEANEGAYWFFGTEEELAEFLAQQQAEEEADGQAIMNKAVKAALEAAIANYSANPNDETEAALEKAKKAATSSIIAYKGVRSSYEMHKQFLSDEALEEFEERLADIIAALNAGTLTGNGIAEMAEIARVAAEVGTETDEELILYSYQTTCEPNQNYVPGGNHGITIDWDAIAADLGTDKEGLKIYAMLPDGTLDETYGRGSTDGWRDAEGNWETWGNLYSTGAPGFYVQLDGLTLAGVGCMNTAEPTTYTANFKVINPAEPEGKAVMLSISLNIKEKEIDTSAPTNVDELTVASTVKQVVTVPIGAGYAAADGTTANVDAILTALGVESLDGVKIFAVESDGSLDPDYQRGSSDGWRDVEGDWAQWGDDASQFYVKADFARAPAQLYEVGCHPDHSGVHMSDVINYTAKYAFVVGNKTENKSVLYNVVVAIAPEATALDETGASVQYFYNVEAKGFILGANNWNTRASIGAKGYQMKFEANGETYKLCATNKTGTSYGANDLDYDGNGDIWVDGAGRSGSGLWTYTVNADKTFTISSAYEPAKGFLSIVPSKDASRLYMSEDPEAMSTWIAVSEDVYTAYSNKAVLAEEKATLADIKEFIESTNVYTQDAYDAYYAIYEEAINKNSAGEVVGNIDNPNTVHGWHATNAYDNFLLSAWTYTNADGTRQCNEFDTPLYINTWSVEADGKENPSPLHVPFFEYWTGDGNSLGAATLEGTVTDLEAGSYAVQAAVRVRIKDGGGDSAYGITLSANGSEPIDVTNGRTCGDGEQFRWNIYFANASVGADGILKIDFNVAADNNISWLSFKNVKYIKQQGMTPIIVTEPATAINEVNAKSAARTIFNAAGQQMKSLQRGLNIVDGKKVYVK